MSLSATVVVVVVTGDVASAPHGDCDWMIMICGAEDQKMTVTQMCFYSIEKHIWAVKGPNI